MQKRESRKVLQRKFTMKRVIGLCLLWVSACVSQDQYDDLSLKNRSLERQLQLSQYRNDSLQRYVDYVLPVLLEKENYKPEVIVIPAAEPSLPAAPEPTPEAVDTLTDEVGDISALRGVERSVAVTPGFVQELEALRQEGVEVIQKNGRYTLVLDQRLLFGSGSVLPNTTARQVLRRLAAVLVKERTHMIMVTGHTDNSTISNMGDIKDNWDLSVMRASNVVKNLVSFGVPPTRLIAAGRGQYEPVAPNTPSNKHMNRRIEIILTPWIRY